MISHIDDGYRMMELLSGGAWTRKPKWEDAADENSKLFFSLFATKPNPEEESWTLSLHMIDLEAPNIIRFTQNFNSISYLTSREVLGGHTPEHRAKLIVFFIHLARKLYQLNNLHATYAIVSALSTQPLFRLSKSWQKVNKNERQQLQQLGELFSPKNNFSNLRSHMESQSMPCIPHLGLYLTDTIFMQGLFGESVMKEDFHRSAPRTHYFQEMLKKSKHPADMKVIQENIDKLLRTVCSYQDSCYDLPYYPHIQAMLAETELPFSMVSPSEKLFYQLSARLEPDDMEQPKEGVRRSSLPLQAIRSLTHSAARFSPNTVVSKSPRRKKSLVDILSPGIFKSTRDTLEGCDNASYTSPVGESNTHWYDTLENEDELSSSVSHRSTNSSRLSELTKRLKSLDIYETASPTKWRLNSKKLWSHLTPRSACSTPKLNRRNGDGVTPELLRRSKTPTPKRETNEQCSLIGDELNEEPELSGIFTKTQTRSKNARNKLIRPSQTCFLELRGRSLYEYERKLVPLYVNADRELFQHRPKRQFQLPDGGWRVGRAESDFHPGFQLEHEITGRAFEYTCRSWSVANHWMKLINEAMDGDGYKEGGGGGRHTQSTKV